LKTFEELGVSAPILKAFQELGFEQPMPVQEEVIPYLLSGANDVIALAETGMGKTAAYGVPIIQKTDPSIVKPQALVLSPTRELCLQITDDLNDYSKYVDIKVLPVYGGSSIESQIQALKRGVHVIVATPGRLQDLMNRKTVDLSLVKNVVLDEADEMLDMNFSEDLDNILASVPSSRSMLLFSATMPKAIEDLTKKYMNNPKEIVIGNKNEGNKNIRDIYYMVHSQDRYLALKRIADYYPNIYGIIFCRTRKETQEIADKLIQDGYNADSLHGDLSQAQRDYVMQKFRIKNLQLLVATDVAARGLDVDNLTHVINYGLPEDTELYTHRRGRTGRAGKTGISISICHLREKGKMREIERVLGKKFEKASLPSGHDICEKQLYNLIDQIEKVEVDETEIATLLPTAIRKLEWLTKEDMMKRVISLEFNRMINYYKDAEEIEEVDENASRDRKSRDEGGRTHTAEAGYSRLFLNFGKMDNLYPNQLIELVNRCVPGKVHIGKIDLRENCSFFEVEEGDAQRTIELMNGFEINGRKLIVEPAQPEKGGKSGKPRFGRFDRKPGPRGKGRFHDSFGGRDGDRKPFRHSSDREWIDRGDRGERMGKSERGRGERSRGDRSRSDFGKGDFGKSDFGKSDRGRGERSNFGKSDRGRSSHSDRNKGRRSR